MKLKQDPYSKKLRKRVIILDLSVFIILAISILTIPLIIIGINISSWKYSVNGWVTRISISSDGQYFVVGGENGNVYLFQSPNSIPKWTYKLDGEINSVAISSDGNYIVVGSSNTKVYLFNRSISQPIWNYSTGSAVNSVAISSNGTYIAAGSYYDRLYYFHYSSSSPIWSHLPSGGEHRISSVCISEDGKYIACGINYNFADCYIRFFENSSSTPLWSHNVGFDDYIRVVDISADGQYIVGGGIDQKLTLLHRSSSTPVWVYDLNYYHVIDIDISADGEYIVLNGQDRNTYLFHRSSQIPIWTYYNGIGEVAISDDGSYIALSTYPNLLLFHKSSPSPLWQTEYYGEVCLSSNGSILIVGNSEGSIFFIDTQDPLIFEDKIMSFIIAFVVSTISLLVLSFIGVRQLKKTKPRRDKKRSLENKIMTNLNLIEKWIEENKMQEVIDKIEECKAILKTEENQKLNEIFQTRLQNLNQTITNFNIALIKKKLLNLSTRYSQITIPEVIEKYNLKDEDLIKKALLEMIKNKEIYADYVPNRKTIIFQLETNLDEIDELMEIYKKWEERNLGKKI
ncbi:MAG: PQQ-binding-like beta-propeller repeat protein [Promethearchaeota archaeon]